MAVEVNGIAHIQLTVNEPEQCVPFWESHCNFLDMKTPILHSALLSDNFSEFISLFVTIH